MNSFKVTIKFKKNKGDNISFTIDSDNRLIQAMQDEVGEHHKCAMCIGEFIIVNDEASDMLWIKIEGDGFEKPRRKKVSNTRKKVK